MNKPSTKTACGQLCSGTKGCTHFTWTSIGGICFMKNNSLISKIDAIFFPHYDVICGVISSKENLNCTGVDVDKRNEVLSIDWRTLGGVSSVKNQLTCNSW